MKQTLSKLELIPECLKFNPASQNGTGYAFHTEKAAADDNVKKKRKSKSAYKFWFWGNDLQNRF